MTKRIICTVLALVLCFGLAMPVFAADSVDYPSTEDWTYQKLKVDEMEEMYSDENWKLYFDKTSAEFALLNVKTGEVYVSVSVCCKTCALNSEDCGVILEVHIETYKVLNCGCLNNNCKRCCCYGSNFAVST